MQHLLVEGFHTAARDWRDNPYPVSRASSSCTILGITKQNESDKLTIEIYLIVHVFNKIL